MEITFVDPDEHGEKGSNLPFWIRFDGVDMTDERHIKKTVGDALGAGSFMPADLQWGYKSVKGYLVLMFRTEEDRMLTRLILS